MDDMFSSKCSCKERDMDGLCKYKFLKSEKSILCCNHKKYKVINCIEEDEQLKILGRRLHEK